MAATWIDLTGTAAATLTTACWLPQAIRIIRTKDTRALSVWTTALFTAGVALWLVYGLARSDWPVVGANACTFTLNALILGLKLRYG